MPNPQETEAEGLEVQGYTGVQGQPGKYEALHLKRKEKKKTKKQTKPRYSSVSQDAETFP